METVGSSSNVAIIVQAEFSTKYTQDMPTSNTSRILVQKDNAAGANLTGIDIGNVNMASPEALTDFIKWATTNYPAQHYALVIWDHGAGWKAGKPVSPLKGAVQDETSGTFMSLPDLAKGVADSGVHFDVINFDACLMAMYEVAYEFNGLTDYMVFSEQTEPGEGDPYDTILAALAATPSMGGQTLASTIVDKYNAFYTTNDRGGTTKSAVDMSKLGTLDTKVLALGAELTSDLLSPAVMTTARTSTQAYTGDTNHDIGALCDYLATSAVGPAVKTAAAELKTVLTSMVIANETNGTDMVDSHGLAIYLPLASETNATELANYASLASNKTARASATGTWGSYLDSLIGVGTASYKPGNFGIRITWTNTSGTVCNSNLDLYVWEPAADYSSTGNGHWYAPRMGQSSPNGLFSADSIVSGKSEEYYLANEQVLTGDYFFLVNYRADGSTCTKAKVHLYLYDPSYGDWLEATSTNFSDISPTLQSPREMDRSNIWTNQDINSLTDLNNYSDWWTPFYITKELNMPQLPDALNMLNMKMTSQIIFK
jgi:hypothetical protein